MDINNLNPLITIDTRCFGFNNDNINNNLILSFNIIKLIRNTIHINHYHQSLSSIEFIISIKPYIPTYYRILFNEFNKSWVIDCYNTFPIIPYDSIDDNVPYFIFNHYFIKNLNHHQHNRFKDIIGKKPITNFDRNIYYPFCLLKKLISHNDYNIIKHLKNLINSSNSSTTPLEVQSNSSPPPPEVNHAVSSPPEVTTTVPLGVEPSSNYLSLKSSATPGDRGEGSDGSSIMGMMEDGAKDVLDVTSSGSGQPGETENSTRKNEDVQPLRTKDVNPEEQTSTEVQSDSLRPADSSSNYLSLKSKATPGDRGDNRDVTSGGSGIPGSDLRELEGEVNIDAVCKTTSSGVDLKRTLDGESEVNMILDKRHVVKRDISSMDLCYDERLLEPIVDGIKIDMGSGLFNYLPSSDTILNILSNTPIELDVDDKLKFMSSNSFTKSSEVKSSTTSHSLAESSSIYFPSDSRRSSSVSRQPGRTENYIRRKEKYKIRRKDYITSSGSGIPVADLWEAEGEPIRRSCLQDDIKWRTGGKKISCKTIRDDNTYNDISNGNKNSSTSVKICVEFIEEYLYSSLVPVSSIILIKTKILNRYIIKPSGNDYFIYNKHSIFIDSSIMADLQLSALGGRVHSIINRGFDNMFTVIAADKFYLLKYTTKSHKHSTSHKIKHVVTIENPSNSNTTSQAQSKSSPPPPEVTTTVPLGVEPSSNYLPLKSKATPGDRGEDGGGDVSSIMGMMEDGAKDMLDVTSCGMKCSTGPQVEPVADLREAEGQLNKESCLQDKERTSSGEAVCKTKEQECQPGRTETVNPEERNIVRIGPQVEPVADLREAEGEVNKEAVCKTTSGGMASRKECVEDKTSSGTTGGQTSVEHSDRSVPTVDDIVMKKVRENYYRVDYIKRDIAYDILMQYNHYDPVLKMRYCVGCFSTDMIDGYLVIGTSYTSQFNLYFYDLISQSGVDAIRLILDVSKCKGFSHLYWIPNSNKIVVLTKNNGELYMIEPKYKRNWVGLIPNFTAIDKNIEIIEEENIFDDIDINPNFYPNNNSIHDNEANINKHITKISSNSSPLPPEVVLPSASPPEVTTSVPLTSTVGPADSSPNSLPVNGNATPRDRGSREGMDVTSSGLPVADLRKAEGEVNRRSVCKTTSGGTASERIESSMGLDGCFVRSKNENCSNGIYSYDGVAYVPNYPFYDVGFSIIGNQWFDKGDEDLCIRDVNNNNLIIHNMELMDIYRSMIKK